MNLFEKFLYLLQAEMETPTSFGWFHWLWIFFIIISLVITIKIKDKCGDKELKIVLGVYSVIALILEILKQLIWSFNYDLVTQIISWDYQWYSFPFQLCTTPIFVCLICMFLKNNTIRKSFLSYMSYITILGGITTIIMPNSCFTSDILVNIHTMWLHCGSFVVSIYLLITGEVEINIKNVKNAIFTFLIFVAIALELNIVIYNTGILNGETFNMFYISPYFISTLPVFDMIQQSVPYLIFLLIYILVIVIGAFIIYLIAKLINHIFNRRKNLIIK